MAKEQGTDLQSEAALWQWLLGDRGRRAKELVLGQAKQIWTSMVSLERLTRGRKTSSGSPELSQDPQQAQTWPGPSLPRPRRR